MVFYVLLQNYYLTHRTIPKLYRHTNRRTDNRLLNDVRLFWPNKLRNFSRTSLVVNVCYGNRWIPWRITLFVVSLKYYLFSCFISNLFADTRTANNTTLTLSFMMSILILSVSDYLNASFLIVLSHLQQFFLSRIEFWWLRLCWTSLSARSVDRPFQDFLTVILPQRLIDRIFEIIFVVNMLNIGIKQLIVHELLLRKRFILRKLRGWTLKILITLLSHPPQNLPFFRVKTNVLILSLDWLINRFLKIDFHLEFY